MNDFTFPAPGAFDGRDDNAPNMSAFVGVTAIEVVVLAMALIISFSLYFASGYTAVAWVAPPAILATLSIANWRMIRRDASALWTPLFSFRIASAVFLGFGGILSENLSLVAQQSYLAELTYTKQEAGQVFLIWLTGVVCVLSGCFIAERMSRSVRAAVPAANQRQRTLPLGLVFVLAGLFYAYFIRLPIELGLLPLGTIPNAISTPFDAALSVGVFLISLWAMQRGGLAMLSIPAVLVPACAVGLLFLTKQAVLLPLVFFGLALLFERITLSRVAAVTILLVASFALLQPMVAYARSLTQVELTLDPGERLSLMKDYLIHGDTGSDPDDTEVDFLRFGHTHVAAFIVDRYDRGMPSDELRNGLTALVPRVIWPDKPEVTRGASDLYFLVSGREGSALAATVFADLYWNVGWPGLLFLSLTWGVLMWVGTRKSLQIVRQRDWFMMPFVLLMFMIGLAQESAFTVAILIPTVMSLIAYFLLTVVRRFAIFEQVPPPLVFSSPFDAGGRLASAGQGPTANR